MKHGRRVGLLGRQPKLVSGTLQILGTANAAAHHFAERDARLRVTRGGEFGQFLPRSDGIAGRPHAIAGHYRLEILAVRLTAICRVFHDCERFGQFALL
ncbi:MAG: hypothetical protein EXR39_07535 [Betaproteobacteria bacterium]|nr:hypothetical protein [Betaproteobacteria bacterium]